MKGLAQRLVLKQRYKETRKWPLKELVHALRAYIELWMKSGSLETREKVLKFHEARPRVALASSVFSKLPKYIHNSIYAQLKA